MIVKIQTPNTIDPLLKKIVITQPNPPIKIDPTKRVGLVQVDFDGLVGWLHAPIFYGLDRLSLAP